MSKDLRYFSETPADEKAKKAAELARRHALEDAIEGEHRTSFSIDAHPAYVSTYKKHRTALKEHEHPYWGQD